MRYHPGKDELFRIEDAVPPGGKWGSLRMEDEV